jgi:hypothetical protein
MKKSQNIALLRRNIGLVDEVFSNFIQKRTGGCGPKNELPRDCGSTCLKDLGRPQDGISENRSTLRAKKLPQSHRHPLRDIVRNHVRPTALAG